VSHSVRYFWASHVVHHSSQKYNLGTALRQTWTVSLIYQFWIHTEAINKMWPPIEFVFNTPSHHRVHHGSDVEYLDRNHGGVLIIWDRLFGTFTEE
ncbi:UNVERIFIED_CONTAM: hypothetical protein GTU68_007320, partial [Idotea baltica]|nr:hypothetical protein [Idotea baltica]